MQQYEQLYNVIFIGPGPGDTVCKFSYVACEHCHFTPESYSLQLEPLTWWHWSCKGLWDRGKDRGRAGVSLSKLKHCMSKWYSDRIIPHECLLFPFLQNIPGHSFLLRSCILIPLLGITLSSWQGMNDFSHRPRGLGFCHLWLSW